MSALRNTAELIRRLEPGECVLCHEAAAHIRRMRKEHNEELREEQRAQQDAYTAGRWDEREEQQW